uniref:Elongation factor Tu-type domain-containing protein n=1 Tax=Trichogramma kaykai TaxID=54128 RepID=A0ABD2WSN6_9HYME
MGIVTSIESNNKPVETARKGQEVCIKIEPIPGEAPKMFGRHFDETDMLVSKVRIIEKIYSDCALYARPCTSRL